MKQQYFYISSLILALTFLAVPVNGQNSTGNEGCNFCFRGKPKGKCCSFLILESGFLKRVAGSGYPSGIENSLITADLGLMFNIKQSSSLGGSFHLAVNNKGSHFGFGPRYRKWLRKEVALDLSPRLLFAGTDNTVHNRYPGFAFLASLAIHEMFSIDTYFELVRYEQQIYTGPLTAETVKGTQKGFYVGASGRSWGALIVPSVIIISTAIIIASI